MASSSPNNNGQAPTISARGAGTGSSEADPNDDLTQCLLTQYRFCAAGIGLGTAYALRYKKGLIPMAAAGALGTSVDMIYGYLVECAEFRQPPPEGEGSSTPTPPSSTSKS